MTNNWTEQQMDKTSIAIVGTVGIPANYGGFETLAERLTAHLGQAYRFTVFCSGKSYSNRLAEYNNARLVYLPLHANGIQSIAYDILSLFHATRQRHDVILLLGVSGAVALPLLRLFSRARIIAHIDGIEWQRQKWRGLAKLFLRLSEKIAVRFADRVIADNQAIAEYLHQFYRIKAQVIAYGGDHAIAADAVKLDEFGLVGNYAFAVCRIEPENNVHMIVEAFAGQNSHALVMVGNWNNGDYGRAIRRQYAHCPNLFLLDPIYDLGKLKTLRSQAAFFVHGHSAGGTNPSLVEAMHFGKPVLAFDCSFNRYTTENKALFFSDSEALQRLTVSLSGAEAESIGKNLKEIAGKRYTWASVARQYAELIGGF